MKELTKAEEQIMQILWDIEKGFVKDVLAKLPRPKPAYNTVSTIIRILEKKGFVSYTAYGKTHEYYPLIEKDEYRTIFLGSIVKNYFSDSYKSLVSFFTKKEDMTLEELEELRKIVNKQIKEKRK